MEKILAMHVAAQLTTAALAGNANVPIDPDIKDPAARARNLQVWETFRIFYRGVAAALEDAKSWPAPYLDASQLLPSLLQNLTPLLSGGPIGDILKKLLAVLPEPIAAPANPLPDPGMKPAA